MKFVNIGEKDGLPVPFMKRKSGSPVISPLGRCGRKKTQFSSSTTASDPCACTYNNGVERKLE